MSSVTAASRGPTADQAAQPWTAISPWVASAALPERPALSWYDRYRRWLWIADTISVTLAVLPVFALLYSMGQPVGRGLLTYGWLGPLLVFGWVVMLGAVDSRDREVIGAGLEEYSRVMKASLYFFGVLAISSYLLESELSRALFVTTLPLGVSLVLLERWGLRKLLHRLRRRGEARTRTLVVGDSDSVADLVPRLDRHTNAGYQPVAICVTDGPEAASRRASTGHASSAAAARLRGLDLPVYGGDAFRVADACDVGAVIVTEGLDRESTRRLAWRLENRPVELMFVPGLVDVAGPRVRVHEAEGLSLMHVDLPRFSGGTLVLKRAFDIAFSSIALVLLAPVLVIVAVLIKLDDGGPVLFRQQRIGRHGRPFTIHKFRTMCIDAEDRIEALISANGGAALLFKLEDDPRVTRIGRFLRKYSIDELPQFWTVLRGGMSVVGPRPQVPREVAEYTAIHHRRLLIKPGITGLWQVSGRSELSMEESIRLDLRYVENWSLVVDVTIILKTVGVVLRAFGAL